MALPPPPNHPQRQAVASTLLQGVRLCIDAAVANREKLCKLLSEHGACISEEPEEDAVHVLESFCGELFDELRRRGARIVGPPCIYESVRCGKPLPDSKYPIYSRVLEGLCITTTGFHARRKSDVEALIRFMGGVYLPDLTNRTHYLVASEVGSEKYFVACQRSIPIVRIEWLLSCWKESAFLTPHDFILSPLAGLTICVTGLSAASRAVVQRLVCQHGGRYSADLTRKCTHLLAYSCEGNKFHYASFWGIPVIRPEWLAEYINVGIYVDPRPFLLTPHAPPTPHTPTVPPQVAALSLPDLPSLPAPLSKSRARAQTLSSLSRSQSTTALEVISDAAAPPPAYLSADVPRAPHITVKKRPAANTRLVISSSRDLRALLADCDAAVESVLNVSTVCALLMRASPQAHPSLWQACVAFAAEHLEELQAQPAFASLSTEVRDCINHTRRAGGEKRRRVGDE